MTQTNGATHHQAKVPQIPLLTDFEEYDRLFTQRSELVRQRSAAQHEIDSLYSAMRAATISESILKRSTRVAELLGDDLPTAQAIDTSKIPGLSEQVAALTVAIEEVDRRLVGARGQVSQEITREIKPYHENLVHRICFAALSLHELAVEYRQLADQLNDRDVAWAGGIGFGLRPMHVRFFGEPNDPHSRLAIYLREAIEYCGFDPALIPDKICWPPRVNPLKAKKNQLAAMAAKLAAGARRPTAAQPEPEPIGERLLP